MKKKKNWNKNKKKGNIKDTILKNGIKNEKRAKKVIETRDTTNKWKNEIKRERQ